MILMVRTSDLNIYQTYQDFPEFDFYTLFPSSTFKILFLGNKGNFVDGDFWDKDLDITKSKFKKSYNRRAEFDFQLYIGSTNIIKAYRYCDLYDKRTTLNTRETAEYTAYRQGRTQLATYNKALEIVTWIDNWYTEKKRLQDAIDACTTVQECFDLIENFPVYNE